MPLEEVRPGEEIDAGPFVVEPVKLAHSIPDMFAYALTCELGTVLATGDYKFDQTPVDGIPADVARLAELGREGILLLFGDSTNADRPGLVAVGINSQSPSGRDVRPLQGTDRRHLGSPPTSTGCRR